MDRAVKIRCLALVAAYWLATHPESASVAMLPDSSIPPFSAVFGAAFRSVTEQSMRVASPPVPATLRKRALERPIFDAKPPDPPVPVSKAQAIVTAPPLSDHPSLSFEVAHADRCSGPEQPWVRFSAKYYHPTMGAVLMKCVSEDAGAAKTMRFRCAYPGKGGVPKELAGEISRTSLGATTFDTPLSGVAERGSYYLDPPDDLRHPHPQLANCYGRKKPRDPYRWAFGGL
ncbi:MAG: hypothetical protein HY059_22590 [Proteobacteria bacterium]|nr:hypothetical protein [Pseudomonadota bacterium]